MARAAYAFNAGVTEIITIMDIMYVEVTDLTLQKLEEKDSWRIKKADVQSSAVAKRWGKGYTSQRRAQVRAQEVQDGNIWRIIYTMLEDTDNV